MRKSFVSWPLLSTRSVSVHDIGIRMCELKYGKCDAKLQEKEGPELARDMLTALGFNEKVTERVCWLVGHHHTYHIDSWDHQILIEADTLVNLYEDGTEKQEIRSAYESLFLSETGKLFCRKMFDL